MAGSIKVIKLTVKPAKEIIGEFATALERARHGGKTEHRVGISFESIDGLRNVLTKRRLELLSVIKHKKPQSVYKLSKLLNRDLKSINTDLKVLKENDFVELRKVNEGRQRVVPVVEFDKIDIMVE